MAFGGMVIDLICSRLGGEIDQLWQCLQPELLRLLSITKDVFQFPSLYLSTALQPPNRKRMKKGRALHLFFKNLTPYAIHIKKTEKHR